MLSIFSCAYWLSAFPLWENGCLCTLDVNLISGMSFANVFSNSVGCLFVLSVISFSVKKLFYIYLSPICVFLLVSFALGERSKIIFLRLRSKNILPIFSSSFIISNIIHLDLLYILSLFLII